MALGGPAVAAADLCDGPDGRPRPNCTVEDPDFGMNDDPGVPAGFVALFVIAAIGGVGTTFYRMSTARNMAKKSGLDPDDAARMAFLEEDGLTATYVMSNLHPKDSASPKADEPDRTVEQRLTELDELRDKGMITQAEYDERRAAIVGSI